jgi:hypothetical protein
VHKKELTHRCFCQLALNTIYLKIISLSAQIILIPSVYLTFVKERPRAEIILSVMYTTLLPDDGKTNRSKRVVEI